MDIRRDINDKLEQLKQKIGFFCEGVSLYLRHDSSEEEVEKAWSIIFNDVVRSTEKILSTLAEDIRWSLLDPHKEEFGVLYEMLRNREAHLKQHVSLQIDTVALHRIGQLLATGRDGFQRLVSEDEDYFTMLLEQEYQRYKEENQGRIEEIYQQDSNDYVYDYPNADERKTIMAKERRKQLFADFYGSYYHDHGRKIPELTLYIIEQKETDYKKIHAFFDKYLSWEHAESMLRNKDAQEYKNIIFRENADVDKIMGKLNELVASKTIKSQKHWFIVYKVFLTKKWLADESQQKFRDQMNSVFGSILKCTKNDFKEVDNYFKENDYDEWSMDDPKAPSCCKVYKEIADLLDKEFQEKQYAKPGLLIAPQKRIKCR